MHRDRKQNGGCQGLERRKECGVIFEKGPDEKVLEKVLEMDGGDGCVTGSMCLMPRTIHGKRVNMLNFMWILPRFLKTGGEKKMSLGIAKCPLGDEIAPTGGPSFSA